MPASGKTPIWDWNIGAWFARIALISLFILGVAGLGYGVFFAETVEANEVGIVYDKDDGKVLRTVEAGVLHPYNPITEEFKTYDRRATIDVTDTAITKDGAYVDVSYRITYVNPPPSTAEYQGEYGSASRLAEINSACVRSHVREAVANHTAETLSQNYNSVATAAASHCENDPFGNGELTVGVRSISLPSEPQPQPPMNESS